MQKQSIANILLYDIAQKNISAEFGVDHQIINEVVERWNRNMYVFPQSEIKLRRQSQKKYVLM